jgi:hypothetical protein
VVIGVQPVLETAYIKVSLITLNSYVSGVNSYAASGKGWCRGDEVDDLRVLPGDDDGPNGPGYTPQRTPNQL